jgi:hypothetical protein
MLALYDMPSREPVAIRPTIVWEDQRQVQSSAASDLELQHMLAFLSLGKPSFAAAIRERREHVAIPLMNLEGDEDAFFSEPAFRVAGSFTAQLKPAILPDLDLGF